MNKINTIALVIAVVTNSTYCFANINQTPSMNHSYDHKFKANGELAKQTGALLNIALNSMPPNQLNSLAEDYLNQVEAIDLSASLYSEERSKNDAIKQKVAESILYLKKHQHISNPRFLPTEGNIAGWCVELANSSCSDSISLFGENAYLDEEQSQTGGYSLIVGKPNIEATVKTTLQTVPGQTYTLSFDMTGNFVKYHTFSYTYQPVYAVVDIGGEKVELNKQHPLVEIDYWIRGNFGHVYAPWDNQENGRKHWEKVELQFVASQQQTTLSFTHKAQTELGQKTSPLMLSNVMVFDDVTADKELSPGKVALIASSTVTVVGAGATLVYLAKKGIIQNVFAKLGLTSTTVGPGTRTMAITTAFDDMYEIMQGSGGRQVIENYLAYPTFEYGAEYFHNPITPSDLDLMADMGFREVATGMSANQLQFEDSATYITKTVSLSTPIEEQTVIKFGSQEQAANFARQLDSYLLREEIAIPGIHQYVNSISVMIGNEEANASVAEHESVIILHSAAEFDVGGVVQIGVTEFISRFAMLRGFDQYIVDSLPFTYNPTSLSGIGWSSIAEDVNLAASTVIHSAYQEGMTVEEFSTAAMEALELAGVVALL